MKITELMDVNVMSMSLESTSKEEVIDELIVLLDQEKRISNVKKFKKAILAREKLSSTGVGNGIAIPHAQVKCVEIPSIVYGYSKEGIDYDSLDGEKAHLFFMIAAPKDGGDLHLQALSKLARLLMKEEFKQGIINAGTKEGVLALINKYQ